MGRIESSEIIFKEAIEKSPNAIVIHENGIFIFANEAAKKLFGAVEDTDIINKKVMNFVDTDIKDILESYLFNLEDICNKNLLKSKFVRCDKSVIYAEVAVVNMGDKDTTRHMILFKDMTEKDLLDKRTQFFIEMSHDLKSPLNVVLSSLQMVDMYECNGVIIDKQNKLHNYNKIMKENCYILLKNINNLIDLNKIEYGEFEACILNYDIVKIIEDNICNISEVAKSKGIAFKFNKFIDTKIVACDKDKIERIIFNLVSNAIKFTDPGGEISINIYIECGCVCMSVKDTGMGIPLDCQELIFDRYKQSKDVKSRNCAGQGLGLSIVKSMVEAHNGEIVIESEEGLGSNFIVKIPDKKVKKNVAITDNYLNTEKFNIEFANLRNA